MPENWVQRPVVNTEAGSNPGAPLAWGSPENPDDAVAGYGYVPCDTSEVEEAFYYHSDHLGSTSYITDQQANVTQYDAYLPYGSNEFHDSHNQVNTWINKTKKEKYIYLQSKNAVLPPCT